MEIRTEKDIVIELHDKVLKASIDAETQLEYFSERRKYLSGKGSIDDKKEITECEQEIKKLKRVVDQNKMYLKVVKAKLATLK